MAYYTAQLRDICESLAGFESHQGQRSVNQIIEEARKKIFDFDYPIFDKDYKGVLETKILKNYYMREICDETYGLWKLHLDNKMNLIMPYYNQFYENTLEGLNPFDDTNYYTDRGKNTGTDAETNSNRVDAGTSETDVNGKENFTGDNWSLFQDTPQNMLDGVKKLEYLTNANEDTSETETKTETKTKNEYEDNSDTSTKSNILTIEDYAEHVHGKRSYTSYAELLLILRQTFLNVDQMIVDECSDLFFGLWM